MLEPFNPQKRFALITWARLELIKAQTAIEMLEELQRRKGIAVDLSDTRSMAERLERWIEDLEKASGFATVN